MAGLTGNNLLVSSSIQYVINVCLTVPALLWGDRWGRRPTLLVGAVLMMTWMYANAGLMASYGHPAPPGGIDGQPAESWEISGPPSKAVIACTYLFVASYAPTWGPVSCKHILVSLQSSCTDITTLGVYPPELYPLRVRGKANALCTSFNWAFNFALGYFTPPAFENIQWKTYIIFGVFCTAMFIHVFFMFPETTGRTLEEVEAIFTDPNGIPYIGTPAWKTSGSFTRAALLEQGFKDEEKAAGAATHEETTK